MSTQAQTIPRFITFEGGEGAGKSTQIDALAKRLSQLGVVPLKTREPGGSAKAEAVRSFLLNGLAEKWGGHAEATLFAAARHDHIKSLILPALENGRFVLCDRFHDSTRAYQGMCGEVSQSYLDALDTLVVGKTLPDLTIILDVDPCIGMKRVHQRQQADDNRDATYDAPLDRFERKPLEWHAHLRREFLQIAKNNSKRCVVVDAGLPQRRVAAAIWHEVIERFDDIKKEQPARTA